MSGMKTSLFSLFLCIFLHDMNTCMSVNANYILLPHPEIHVIPFSKVTLMSRPTCTTYLRNIHNIFGFCCMCNKSTFAVHIKLDA